LSASISGLFQGAANDAWYQGSMAAIIVNAAVGSLKLKFNRQCTTRTKTESLTVRLSSSRRNQSTNQRIADPENVSKYPI
jgi:hypothetical protein